MSQSKPRILLSSPCFREVDPAVLEDWMRFTYQCGRYLPQYDFFVGIKTKTEQFRARNAIVEGAQQHNIDWILMLDDDMIIDIEDAENKPGKPCSPYLFIDKLIQHDKPICGVLYRQRGAECAPVLMKEIPHGYRFLRDDELEYGLQRVDVAGGGCLLIKTSVFDKIPFPYFAPEHQWGTDIQLCQQAKKKGIEVWADTSIELGHLKSEKVIVTSRNAHQFKRDTNVLGQVKQTFVESDLYGRLTQDALQYTGRPDLDAIYHDANAFLDEGKDPAMTDAEWYRQFPMERVCRQVWYNTGNSIKKMMTQYIIGAIAHHRPLKILDFGCGIGVTAFMLAEKGHHVTAMDIRGTGTFEFLKWRARTHGVNIRFVDSEGGVPNLDGEEFDVIIAMDSIEHIKEWRQVVHALARTLKPHGMFFSNNGILDDMTQPEHYEVPNKEFIAECMEADMMPFNQLTFLKKEVKPTEKENEYAEVANSVS